jgi:hypothetical protein
MNCLEIVGFLSIQTCTRVEKLGANTSEVRFSQVQQPYTGSVLAACNHVFVSCARPIVTIKEYKWIVKGMFH